MQALSGGTFPLCCIGSRRQQEHNIVNYMVYLIVNYMVYLKKESVQPADGPWKRPKHVFGINYVTTS